MNKDDLYHLRYFIALGVLLTGFYIYSASVGWKWVGGTRTEKEKSSSAHGGPGSHRYYIHK